MHMLTYIRSSGWEMKFEKAEARVALDQRPTKILQMIQMAVYLGSSRIYLSCCRARIFHLISPLVGTTSPTWASR